MKCYNHNDVYAVAICKSCNKALCRDCSVEVINGIACKNSCEEQVIYLNEIINRSKGYAKLINKSEKDWSKASFGGVVVNVLLGGVFLIMGVLEQKNMNLAIMLIAIGLIFFLGAYFSFSRSQKTKE
jgi:hypothetical protein